MPASNTPKLHLSVTIINYRTAQQTINCLESLLPQLDRIDAKVLIVDNCSGDGSVECIGGWLKKNDPKKIGKILESHTNGGFSYGNNVGIRDTPARLHLLLNSDTLVRPGAIETMLDTALKYPDAGIISPALESLDGTPQESCFRFHSPISEFRSAAKTGLIDRLFSRFIVPLEIAKVISQPEWTSFACVMLRHELVESAGHLDEGYFMYFEDAEYCYRARNSGWHIVHNPRARVVHLRGGSSPVKENTRLKLRLPRYYYESRSRYFYQLYGMFGLISANLLWSTGRMISRFRQLLGNDDKAAIENEWRDIWINWKHPLADYTHPSSEN